MAKDSSTAETSVVKLTRKQAAIVLMLFAVSLLAVGLLVGLIKPQRSSLSVGPLAAASSAADVRGTAPWLNTRLPRHVLPIHYDLSLFPDFYQDAAAFSGNVSILINVTSRPTRYLLVHANKLAIHRTTVRLHRSSETTQVYLFIGYIDCVYTTEHKIVLITGGGFRHDS